MVRRIAMTTDTCRQPGNGDGFRTHAVEKEWLKDSVSSGRRFPFGLPRSDNANYLWIQLFRSVLDKKGRGRFVMANGTRISHSCAVKTTEAIRKYVAGHR
jgi:type I restriction-modification system DNA methylase subunit